MRNPLIKTEPDQPQEQLVKLNPKNIKKFLIYRHFTKQYDPSLWYFVPSLGDLEKNSIRWLLGKRLLTRVGERDFEVLETIDHEYTDNKGKTHKVTNWTKFNQALARIREEHGHHSVNEEIKFMATGSWEFDKRHTARDIMEFVTGYEKANPDDIIEDSEVDKMFETIKTLHLSDISA